MADSDNLDQAAELQDNMNRTALASLRRDAAAAAKPPADFDGKTCGGCGEEIPAGRLALGKYNCVHCQQRKENK